MVRRSLWKEITVPYCLYASEVTRYREGDVVQLEKGSECCWKMGSGDHGEHSSGGDMGWSTFREKRIKGKLGLLKKIEMYGENQWVKKVFQENRVENSSWIKEFERWKRRESIADMWDE